jgi:hypothetical protein
VLSNFEFAGGSVSGREHRRGIPRNKQDAYHLERTPYGVILLVADGCGSGSDTEVGAAIAVRLAVTYIHRLLARGYKPGPGLLDRVRQSVLSQIHILAQDMGESLSEVVNRYFLFTLGGAIITEEETTFFFLGDGVVIINGEVIVLDSGPTNRPIYPAYALTGSTLTDGDPSKLQFQIVRQCPTTELQSFLVGTDGVNDVIEHEASILPGSSSEPFGPISQFWEQSRFFGDGAPVAITRRLNLMARDWKRSGSAGRHVIDSGLLSDDTTLVVGRRSSSQEE